ncbi:protein THEMIS2 [Pangasianodon hypophthalmus]|uniref:protein THEMIS2 n=1 Tax=Pangasianodon hypophthalmus TaxID=310915 RepID=UPI002307E95C|nr:protein THEMIS2 [Pangasianodon hypophthalmus]
MEDSAGVLALQDYIKNVDPSSLPRILQVCSGVYFQGSVYEISGSEVCLSTGDLVKVTSFEILSVSCEDISNNTTFELPLDHSGLFTLVPEDLPYSTIEEMVGLLPVGVDALGSFIFFSNNELTIENLTVPAGTKMTLLSVDLNKDGESFARCRLTGQQEASAEVYIPFSYHGDFYECQNDRGYSLHEIMSSARLCRRRFYRTKPKKCGNPLIFSPIYQIQGIMHLRKNIVKFPSSLEVDVIDVTEQCKHLTFVTPLSLAEVAAQPKEAFPTMAEILEGPEANPYFCCSWFKELQKCKHLVLHGCNKTCMVLACTPKGRKTQQYFLLSQDYGGQIRRRAREFSSVYEVYVAFSSSPGLRVSVTRHCEAVEEEGVPALSVGEQLEVLRVQTANRSGRELGDPQGVDGLICKRIEDEDEDDDDDEDEDESERESEVWLPLFTLANFVEKLSDKKKYSLAELCKNFSFPLDVKVVNHDKTLDKDPLAGLAALRLEESLEETTVLASLPDTPEQCFELPLRWLQMSLSFVLDPLPWPESKNPKVHLQTVTEVTEYFYHEYHKLTTKPMAPPPRPPKRKSLSLQSQKGCVTHKDATLQVKSSHPIAKVDSSSLDQTKRRPPPPPPNETEDVPPPLVPRKSVSESLAILNTYVLSPRKPNEKPHKSERKSSDSDHDYEPVEDMLNAFDHIMFY